MDSLHRQVEGSKFGLYASLYSLELTFWVFYVNFPLPSMLTNQSLEFDIVLEYCKI